MPPEGVRWLCNGPRTARVLSEYGLPAEYPNSGHTSEDVYKMVQGSLTSSQRYLIICGEGGRDWMRQTLQQQGVQVGVIRCYQRAVNTQVLAQMTELITTCQALWLSSEYLGEALIAQAAEFWRSWPGAWWLSSNRLDQWAEQQGIINRFQAGGATPEDLSRLIKQHAGA